MALKNITFSAEEAKIEKARDYARSLHTTLNTMFREWLDDCAKRNSTGAEDAAAFRAMLSRLSHIRSHGPYTRDEMHER
jgi:hypothetical protein